MNTKSTKNLSFGVLWFWIILLTLFKPMTKWQINLPINSKTQIYLEERMMKLENQITMQWLVIIVIELNVSLKNTYIL